MGSSAFGFGVAATGADRALPAGLGGGSNTNIKPATMTKAVMAAPKAPIRAASFPRPCCMCHAADLRQENTTATNKTDNSKASFIETSVERVAQHNGFVAIRASGEYVHRNAHEFFYALDVSLGIGG